MSRDLPYFKFYTSEWLNGDITLEDEALQGLFINVCAYYWHRGCEVTYQQLDKRFRNNDLVNLIPEFMTCDEENNHIIRIAFLDEQYSEFTVRKKKLSDAGKKGAKLKKEKALFQPPLNHPSTIREEIEEDKSKTIEDRKVDFKKSLAIHLPQFGKELLNEFYSYWTEHGENDKKMRFEKQTSFSLKRRLGTWKQRQKDGSKFKGNPKGNQARVTQSGRQDFD